MAQFKRIDPQALFAQAFTGLRKFDRDLLRILAELMTSLNTLFDRGLTFSENMETQQIDYTTNAVADTEDAVAHTLDKIPSGFIVVNKDKAGDFYQSGTTWTASNIYLKCNAASVTVSILVF